MIFVAIAIQLRLSRLLELTYAQGRVEVDTITRLVIYSSYGERVSTANRGADALQTHGIQTLPDPAPCLLSPVPAPLFPAETPPTQAFSPPSVGYCKPHSAPAHSCYMYSVSDDRYLKVRVFLGIVARYSIVPCTAKYVGRDRAFFFL